MLERPDLQDARIIACLQEDYGVAVVQLDILPLGADLQNYNPTWPQEFEAIKETLAQVLDPFALRIDHSERIQTRRDQSS